MGGNPGSYNVTNILRYHNKKMLNTFLNNFRNMRETNQMQPIWDTMKILFFGTKDKDPIEVIEKTGIDLRHKTADADAEYGSAWYFYQTV